MPDATPNPWRDEPDFLVPELAPIGLDRIPPEHLSRHYLVTGESGAGKTDSALRPILRAVLRYPEAPGMTPDKVARLRSSVLLIDPKRELFPEAVRENRRSRAGRRIVQLSASDSMVANLFEGVDIGRVGVDELMARMLVLTPSYHEEQLKTNSAFFILQASLSFRAMLECDLAIYRRDGVRGLRDFWAAMQQALARQFGSVPDGMQYERVAYLRPHAILMAMIAANQSSALQIYMATATKFGAPASALLPLGSWLVMRDDTVAAVIATAFNFISDLTNAFADRVSVNPFEAPPAKRFLSVRQALDEGWLVALSPNVHDPIDVSVAVAVKALFFQHAFTRSQKDRPFIYMADECHLALTIDRSAEHQFLDRCRAYRCAAILATQGISSMRYRLHSLAGAMQAQSALDILLTNTATKLWFRSTDDDNRRKLRTLIPGPELGGKAHVVDVCPPSVLQTGECYALGPRHWARGVAAVAPEHLSSHAPARERQTRRVSDP